MLYQQLIQSPLFRPKVQQFYRTMIQRLIQSQNVIKKKHYIFLKSLNHIIFQFCLFYTILTWHRSVSNSSLFFMDRFCEYLFFSSIFCAITIFETLPCQLRIVKSYEKQLKQTLSCPWENGIWFTKILWPTVRKKCSSDREKHWDH